jgi:hypothetical protein
MKDDFRKFNILGPISGCLELHGVQMRRLEHRGYEEMSSTLLTNSAPRIRVQIREDGGGDGLRGLSQ